MSPLDDAAIELLSPAAAELGFHLVHQRDREAVLQRAYEGSGYMSALKIYMRAVRQGKNLGISRAFTEEWARKQEALQLTRPPKAVLSNPTRVGGCWELAAADLFFMETAFGGYIGGLLMIDAFSGWVCTHALKDKRAESVAKGFATFFEFGFIPRALRVDGGGEYMGACAELLLKFRVHMRIGISSHTNTSSAERAIRTVKVLLTRTKAEDGEMWPRALGRVTLGLNTTVGPRGASPHDILFRRVPGLVQQLDAEAPPEPQIVEPTAPFAIAPDFADDHLSKDQIVEETRVAMARNADRMVLRSAKSLPDLHPGDMVRVALQALDAAARRAAPKTKASTSTFWTQERYKVEGATPGRIEGLLVYKLEGLTGGFRRQDLLLSSLPAPGG